MSQGSEQRSIIHPTLHHFGVVTLHLEEMINWYAKVLGMGTVHASSAPLGKEAPLSAKAVWVEASELRRGLGMEIADGVC